MSIHHTLTKTRFAPSPTGHLHLGNLRTALFNALLARRDQGIFLLRIEDTDATRSREDFAQALQEDLQWLGLAWQEGPQVGGPQAPYAQAARGAIYQQYYQQLEDAGLAYPCFCSEEALKLSRKAQLSAGRAPRYAGTCARLSATEIEARLAQCIKPSLRFRVSDEESIAFDDLVRGALHFNGADIGDFIIRRSDGSPAFFFSNALDDALMGVSHVLRGEDHLTNTPRQLLILRALDLPMPRYGHISLIMDAHGAPLSKRLGALSARALRAQGFLPLAILNHLARLGHTLDSDALLSFAELAQAFSESRLGRAPARHDETQLQHWQRLAVNALDETALQQWLEHSEVLQEIPAAQQQAFLATIRDNIELPADARVWAQRLLVDPLDHEPAAREAVVQAGAAFFHSAIKLLDTQPNWDFREFSKTLGQQTGLKGRALFMPLRAALSGVDHGPEMARVWQFLGPERARIRFIQATDL